MRSYEFWNRAWQFTRFGMKRRVRELGLILWVIVTLYLAYSYIRDTEYDYAIVMNACDSMELIARPDRIDWGVVSKISFYCTK